MQEGAPSFVAGGQHMAVPCRQGLPRKLYNLLHTGSWAASKTFLSYLSIKILPVHMMPCLLAAWYTCLSSPLQGGQTPLTAASVALVLS